jgi:hypothetical protein
MLKRKYNTETSNKLVRLTFKANNIQLVLNLLNTTQKYTILEACLHNGIYIPHFCYNKFLQIAGNCRICIVEVEKILKPIISCLNLVVENLNIFVNSFSIKKYRENVLEFLLINHPLDCPICDQAGECDLQEQTIKFGIDKSRFFKVKKTNFDIYLNNYIKLILNRCILCVRCVRYLREVNIDNNFVNILGTIGRGSLSKIHVYKNLNISISNSINIVDICPVGALTLKLNQFSYRPWELISHITFDYFDSFGLSIRVDFKNSKIIRVLPELDSIFFIESISDLTRLKSKFLNILSLNSNNFDNSYINNMFFNSKIVVLNLINNCFINFKNINIFFFSLLNKFKFFKTNSNYYLNNLNNYIISNKFFKNLNTMASIIINPNFKFYMFRFFLFLNIINKNFKNIKFFNTRDLTFFQLFCSSYCAIKKSIIFNNIKTNYSNLELNIYLIKYLSFFKSVLSFDNLLNFKLLNINNTIQSNFIIYIDSLKLLLNKSFKNNISLFYNINHNYDLDSIYNLLGKNIKSLSMNLKHFNFKSKQSYFTYHFSFANRISWECLYIKYLRRLEFGHPDRVAFDDPYINLNQYNGWNKNNEYRVEDDYDKEGYNRLGHWNPRHDNHKEKALIRSKSFIKFFFELKKEKNLSYLAKLVAYRKFRRKYAYGIKLEHSPDDLWI